MAEEETASQANWKESIGKPVPLSKKESSVASRASARSKPKLWDWLEIRRRIPSGRQAL